MPADNEPLHDEACYLAMQAHDARFDGRFFTGVTSTGIYCRPVCRVRLPRRENCRFFRNAAQAEGAGFRPCLRCRPELAPQRMAWSSQDATALLAAHATRLIDETDAWTDGSPDMAALAQRLGVSDRHLRRIFEQHLGVSPLQYLQTRRLLAAKQLLADTSLPIAQVALMSGFASLRRFNAAFALRYGMAPTQLRRARAHGSGAAGVESSRQGANLSGGAVVRLGWRPPYDTQAIASFFAARQIGGVEQFDQASGTLRRTLALTVGGRRHAGWIAARLDPARFQLALTVSDSLVPVLPTVIRRARAAYDLDADPQAINALLDASFPAAGGLRVPGTFCGFELAVRAVLGQQVTVAAARTFAQRLAQRFGEPLPTPWPGLDRLFPSAQTLAAAAPEAIGALGIVRQRQGAIVALARAVADETLMLHGASDVAATIEQLRSLPGIGDWTAQYIAMRALRWPDAFPAGDVALHQALGVRDAPQPARAAQAASQAWRPWRSYAVIRAWARLAPSAHPAPSRLQRS